MNSLSKTLRVELQQAVDDRERMLSMGWSRRKDIDRLRAALGRATMFLRAYPYADDGRVKSWCMANIDDVRVIVPGNNLRALGRLIMASLKPAPKQWVIQLFPSDPAA